MIRKLAVTILCAGWILTSSVRAHEGGRHLRGTIREVAPDHLVLQTDTGDVTVMVTPATQVTRSGGADDHTSPAAGERAVVHARVAADGKLDATEVKLAPKR